MKCIIARIELDIWAGKRETAKRKIPKYQTLEEIKKKVFLLKKNEIPVQKKSTTQVEWINLQNSDVRRYRS